MPIHLITAQPRTGKTLLMMQMLVSAIRANLEVAKSGKGIHRPLFALGVDGLDVTRLGFEASAVTILESGAFERKDKDGIEREGRQWESCPDDSMIFVDEAWKWFGDVSDARSVKRPDYVLGLAEHGHRGIDFVWTTQMTSQLFTFARGVMGNHTHMLRHLGMGVCTLYQWTEMCEDVKSQTQRDRSIQEKWVYPKKLYRIYKSASNHHVKRNIPWRVVLIPACVLGAVALGWFAYAKMKSYGLEQETRINAESGAAAPALASSPEPDDGKKPPMTDEEWQKRITPRWAGVHGSQPIYDSRKVVSEPRTFCVIVGEPSVEECHCYTEQMTRLPDVLFGTCKAYVRQGVYDPFLKPLRVTSESREFRAPVTPTPDPAPTLGVSFDQPLVIPGAVLQ